MTLKHYYSVFDIPYTCGMMMTMHKAVHIAQIPQIPLKSRLIQVKLQFILCFFYMCFSSEILSQ